MTLETFHMRTEEDLLALIPVTLGFHPADSLVLLCLDSELQVFQARVDLPDRPEHLTDMVDLLHNAALRNRARLAFLVAYTSDDRLARRCVNRLSRVLIEDHIETLMRLRVDDGRWFPLLPRSSGDLRVRAGVAFDVAAHELSARSVYTGQVVHPDRDSMARTIAPTDPARVRAVHAAHAALPGLRLGDTSMLSCEAEWLQRRVRERVSAGGAEDGPGWSAEVTARVLRAITPGVVRDYALGLIDREHAHAHLRLWRQVVTESPEELVAPAAALMAFAAWAHGDGALAWVGVERARDSDPEHSLARLVADFLEAAVSPKDWRPYPTDLLGLDVG